MKKLVFILGLLVGITLYAEEKSNITKAVSSVVSEVVSTGKDVLKGVKAVSYTHLTLPTIRLV